MLFDVRVMIYKIIILLVFIIIVDCSKNDIGQCNNIELIKIKDIETKGNAGFEYYTINNKHYLLSANFWDGNSRDMSAKSQLLEFNVNDNSIKSIQDFDGKGAHGVDFFTFKNKSFMIIPSYYGCQDNQVQCFSTIVYQLNDETNRFDIHQRLHTDGPSQTDHFETSLGQQYIVIAENFANKVTIMKMNDLFMFEVFQQLDCSGVASIAIETLNDSTFLVAASYHNNGWKTSSLVFKLSIITNKFELVQTLQTYGAHDAEMIIYKKQFFLFFSEDRNELTSMISSSLYLYDNITNKFQLIQKIQTDGAHAAELFVNTGGDLYLAIANFGNRLDSRYESLSKIYKWNDELNEMSMIAQIETYGATDFEHFSINNIDYIIVSNEGDIGNRLHQTSFLYQLKAT